MISLFFKERVGNIATVVVLIAVCVTVIGKRKAEKELCLMKEITIEVFINIQQEITAISLSIKAVSIFIEPKQDD